MMSAEFVIVWGAVGSGLGGLLAARRVGLNEPCEKPATVLRALLTGALFAAAAWRFADDSAVIAFSYLMAIGIASCAVDLAEQRLPSELILPSYGVVAAAVLASAATTGDEVTLVRVGAAGLMSFTFHLLLAVGSRGGLGAGDVKLAGLLGLAAGWLSWAAVLSGLLLAWATAAVTVALRSRTASDHGADGDGVFPAVAIVGV